MSALGVFWQNDILVKNKHSKNAEQSDGDNTVKIFSTLPGVGLAGVMLAVVGGAWFYQQSGHDVGQSERIRNLALAAQLDCPAGYHATDPVQYAREFNPSLSDVQAKRIREHYGEVTCAYNRIPESMAEIDQWGGFSHEAASAPLGLVPPGAMRAAVNQKSAMQPLQDKVANAAGQWRNYGTGPQVSLDEYADGSRDGIPSVAGRVDDFAYDKVNQRLFAAVATGGIWMSQAVNGDVGTLADEWTDIGKNMPTTIASAVAWTDAQGGRLITLTGEHVQGGNAYVGLGAFWSDDLGASWNQAQGVPDATGAAQLAVDQSNTSIVYAATHKGLFRSDDAGATFTNLNLPVSDDCAGVVTQSGPCQLANVVTDVVVKQPGGASDINCDPKGCPVLAAVGFRGGNAPYADGVPQAPGNGLYRSETGEPGTFKRVDKPAIPAAGGIPPIGFAPQERIGRIELGAAIGEAQDHDIVYAIVQDAVLLNGGLPILDVPLEQGLPEIPLDCSQLPEGDPQFICETVTGGLSPTSINGVYVSRDFGDSWIRLADDINLTYTSIGSGSALAAAAALGVGPGIQAWYNLWVQPDPTLADPLLNAPTRVAFGMEEVWKNTLSGLPPVPVINDAINNAADAAGVNAVIQQFSTGLAPVVGVVEQLPALDWEVFGSYFAGETCLFLIGNVGPGVPVCPVYDGVINGTTTHPDQHDGLFIPDPERGGVWLFAGGDGGVFKQYSANPITDDFANNKWGDGANQGFYTLMNYGIAAAKDGTVFYGLQDNASGKIEPGTGRQIRTYVGDGVWVAVDPDNADVAYVQTPGLSINRTDDGGRSHSLIAPSTEVGAAHFLGPFMMDPQNADHLVAVGSKVAETLDASTDATWVEVFDLGLDEASGVPHQARHRPLDVEGEHIYAGWCGPCNATGPDSQFKRGIATNVAGDTAAQAGSSDGWHQASLNGLPNRFIYGVEMDSANPQTVFVTLGGYSTARWLPVGGYLDENANIGEGHVFRSDDAGENFVDVSGNLPDTNVTAILKRGQQLIVGTDIGVFISSDLNGSQWAPLGDLENVPVNQLVLQPGDDRNLFAGTFGRGVKLYRFEQHAGGTGGNGDSGNGGEADVAGASRGGVLGGGSLLLLAMAAVALRRRRQHA